MNKTLQTTVLGLILLAGCGKSGPSEADKTALYQAAHTQVESLKEKIAEIETIKKSALDLQRTYVYKKATDPNAEKSIQELDESIKSANETLKLLEEKLAQAQGVINDNTPATLK